MVSTVLQPTSAFPVAYMLGLRPKTFPSRLHSHACIRLTVRRSTGASPVAAVGRGKRLSGCQSLAPPGQARWRPHDAKHLLGLSPRPRGFQGIGGSEMWLSWSGTSDRQKFSRSIPPKPTHRFWRRGSFLFFCPHSFASKPSSSRFEAKEWGQKNEKSRAETQLGCGQGLRYGYLCSSVVKAQFNDSPKNSAHITWERKTRIYTGQSEVWWTSSLAFSA